MPSVLLYGLHSFLKTDEKHIYESNKEPCRHIWGMPFNKITEQAREKRKIWYLFSKPSWVREEVATWSTVQSTITHLPWTPWDLHPLPWEPHRVISLIGLSKLILPCHHRSLKGMYRSRGQMPGSVLLNTFLAGGGSREMGRSLGQVLTVLRSNLNHSWMCSSFIPFLFSYFDRQRNS